MFGFDPKQFTILIFGGSQGARAINRIMVEILPKIIRHRDDIQVIYQTGKLDYMQVIKEIESRGIDIFKTSHLLIKDYIYNMEHAFACSDLVISRAGAISIAEITGRGLPSILIPLPSSAEGHQEKNAKTLENAGASILINERDLNSKTLFYAINQIIDNPELRIEMGKQSKRLGRPRAANDLADIAISLAVGQALDP